MMIFGCGAFAGWALNSLIDNLRRREWGWAGFMAFAVFFFTVDAVHYAGEHLP